MNEIEVKPNKISERFSQEMKFQVYNYKGDGVYGGCWGWESDEDMNFKAIRADGTSVAVMRDWAYFYFNFITDEDLEEKKLEKKRITQEVSMVEKDR